MKKLLLFILLFPFFLQAQDSISRTHDSIIKGSSVTLSDIVNTSYSWSPGGATTQTITVSPIASTTYTVTRTTNGVARTGTAFIYVDTSSAYCPQSQRLFDSVPDIASWTKAIIDTRIRAMIANGTYDSIKMCVIDIISLNAFQSLRDIKTCKISSEFYGSTAFADPYNQVQAIPSIYGYNFLGSGFLKTNTIPSVSMKLNNSAIAIGILENESASATYNFGALNTASLCLDFSKKYSTNAEIADAYGITTGRISIASASGNKGVVIINRQSSTSMRLNDNGTVNSIATSQGSLPTYQMYLNCYNNAGAASTRRNKPIDFFCVYGQGLTNAQEAQEMTDWQTFKTAMGRIGSYNKNIVLDGNSLFTYYMAKVFRTAQYDLSNDNWKIYNAAVSGQTTANMLFDESTQILPLYDSTCSKNILIAWELTNEMYNGAPLVTCENNYKTYCLNAKAAGFKVITMGMLPRKYVGNHSGLNQTQWNLKVDSANVYIRDSSSTFSDAYVPFPNSHFIKWRSSYSTDAAFNTDIAAILADPIYFQSDGIHMKEYAFELIGHDCATKIKTF